MDREWQTSKKSINLMNMPREVITIFATKGQKSKQKNPPTIINSSKGSVSSKHYIHIEISDSVTSWVIIWQKGLIEFLVLAIN